VTASLTDWTHTTIGALGRVLTGRTPSSAKPELFGSEYPFITPTDIQEGQHFVRTDRFLSEEGMQSQSSLILPPKTICFVCIGATIGKICVTDRPSFTNQQINSIIVDQGEHDYRFVYHLLRFEADRIKAQAGGAATPIVNKTAFSNVEVLVPALRVQQRIGGTLAAYDDLIENNTRRIKILEETAKMIYDEWFVNFRFPSHEKATMLESELGPIPAAWHVKEMQEVAEVIDCLHSKKPEECENGVGTLLQLFNIGEDGELDLSKRYLISESDYRLWISRIEVAAGDCVVTNVGRIAAVAQIPEGTRAALGRNMTAIRPIRTGITPTFLIQYLLSPHMSSEVRKKKDAGTIMDSLNVKGIIRLCVPLPPRDLMLRYEEIARPVRRQIEVLIAKNINLRQTRDLLLPKLISGKVNVENCEAEAIAQSV